MELALDGEKGQIMIRKRVLKVIQLFILIILLVNISVTNRAHSTEFEIDEIIAAIKNEIKTRRLPSGPGIMQARG